MSDTVCNWNNFVRFCKDPEGIHRNFEDLCRQLFEHEFISDNLIHRYLHVNPNNPGIEADPILCEKTNKLIGFQAKYFESGRNYNSIKESVQQTIEHYKGHLDIFYLYCNKSISREAKTIKDCIKCLAACNISMEIISDSELLDCVSKYPDLKEYYFGDHSITDTWLNEYTNSIIDQLGVRYNGAFNIDTITSNKLSLFVCDRDAVNFINQKKENVINEVHKIYYPSNDPSNATYLLKVKEAVNKLKDVTTQTISESYNWKSDVEKSVQEISASIQTELHKYKLQFLATSEDINQRTNSQNDDYFDYLAYKVRRIQDMLMLPDLLSISEEKSLIEGKVLLICGKAGSGKTQLLANETMKLIKENRYAVLLIGNTFYAADPIEKQIMDQLLCNYDFTKLLNILDCIGDKQKCPVPLFIDALNETWNCRLWKSGLPGIIRKVMKCKYVKLILSFRNEYRESLIPDNILDKNKSIIEISHAGFNDKAGIDEVKNFLRENNIPFSFSEYFEYPMRNPLFLTLYCRTYTGRKRHGKEACIADLYDELLSSVNKKLRITLKNPQFSNSVDGENFVSNLIDQIALKMLSTGKREITMSDLKQLDFSEYSGYISLQEMINGLITENVLNKSIFNDNDVFLFTYRSSN